MKKVTLYFTIILFAFVENGHAQKSMQLFALDTSDRRIVYYRSLIKSNENIASFIEYTLSQNGIPIALRNLALIESAFNNKALSVANAAGIWQLTISHAISYGLTDIERYDLLKSTKIAVQTISRLYRRYHDWRIVVAAYNCGGGNISKAITKANSVSYEDFSIYLPSETKEHVYKFLLACYASGELKMINMPTKNIHQPGIEYKEPIITTTISGGFLLKVIADKLQITEGILRSLNPEFENELAKNGTTNLVLPIDKMPDFLLQKNEILTASLN